MTGQVRIAVLVSRIRVEEKLLLTALEASGAAVQVVNDDELVLPDQSAASPASHRGRCGAGALGQRGTRHLRAAHPRERSATAPSTAMPRRPPAGTS